MTKHPCNSQGKRNRGFFEFDAAIGLAILAVLLGTIVLSVHAVNRVRETLADRREATRLAERALVEPDALPATAAVTFAEAGVGVGVAGDSRHWVEATATVNGESATLVGLMPEVPR